MSVLDATSLSNLEVIGRLALVAGLGAVIGTEREFDGQDAGTRTHALLSLGAGLFGVLSVGAFSGFIAERASTNVQVDVTRIASYVAAGVGFLGGGAIVKQTHRVRGLTTAASLWTAAAVGLAAGLGFWIGAVAASVATVVMLLLDRPLARLRHRNEMTAVSVTLVADLNPTELMAEMVALGGPHTKLDVKRTSDGTVIAVENIRTPAAREFAATLAGRADIVEFSIG